MSPTALTLTADQAMLLVADGMDRFQWSFQIAADGSLVNGEPFQRLEMPEEGLFSGVGGLTVDTLGYLWATSADGHSGLRAARTLHEHPQQAGVHGDADRRASHSAGRIARGCYVTQGGKIFRRETKRTGVVAWEPVKPPQPGL